MPSLSGTKDGETKVHLPAIASLSCIAAPSSRTECQVLTLLPHVRMLGARLRTSQTAKNGKCLLAFSRKLPSNIFHRFSTNPASNSSHAAQAVVETCVGKMSSGFIELCCMCSCGSEVESMLPASATQWKGPSKFQPFSTLCSWRAANNKPY